MQPLRIVALVDMTHSTAMVLNRPLSMRFKKVGQSYLGSDGPFREYYYYSASTAGMRAFAGARIALPMEDGSTDVIQDDWWSSCAPGAIDAGGVSDVATLRRCYVFTGGISAMADELAALRAAYKGVIYPYYDYRKIITFDDMQEKLRRTAEHEKRRRIALTRAVKAKHRELQTLRAALPTPALHPFSFLATA